jgi:hypothetical protein
MTSKRAFRDSYDFAIIDSAPLDPSFELNEALIEAINGPPQDSVLCNQKKILVYPKNSLRLH